MTRAGRDGGRLGFSATRLLETGEETGSPGLAAFCTTQRHTPVAREARQIMARLFWDLGDAAPRPALSRRPRVPA